MIDPRLTFSRVWKWEYVLQRVSLRVKVMILVGSFATLVAIDLLSTNRPVLDFVYVAAAPILLFLIWSFDGGGRPGMICALILGAINVLTLYWDPAGLGRLIGFLVVSTAVVLMFNGPPRRGGGDWKRGHG